MPVRTSPRPTPPPSATPYSRIQELLKKLDFQPQNVLDAAANNPGLFKLAIDFRLECLRRRNQMKMQYEQTSAEKELAIRKEARETRTKITNDEVTALLLVDKVVAASRRQFEAADEMDEYSKLVVEAFRMRRDSLRIVEDLVKDEMGLQRAVEQTAEKVAETRRKLYERFPGGN